MIRNLAINCSKSSIVYTIRRCSSNLTKFPNTPEKCAVLDATRLIPADDDFLETVQIEKSVLEPCDEDLSHVAPYLKPTFNFAAYINKSHTLQELFRLGVNLHRLEKNTDCFAYILSLDVDKDVKQHVEFLYNLQLTTDDVGNFITKNPFFFKEHLDNLQVRLNYLKSKKFDDKMITRIVQKNPQWLSINVKEIDDKLGFFQKNFALSGPEVRFLTVKKPKLITYEQKKIKLNAFVLKEEMGFSPDEVKQIILHTPGLLMNYQNKILATFEYLHRTMGIPLETLAKCPNVLTCREFRLKQRHLFLEKLGKLQFDPKQPNYVSLQGLVTGDDSYFATEIAKSSIQTFNAFLKSL